MSTEKEFLKRLCRPEKLLTDNFRFAINAWQSVEFQSTGKYEIVLNWIADVVPAIQIENDFPVIELTELVSLRAQPGLISQSTKHRFVAELLKTCSKFKNTTTRAIPEFLKKLNDFEIIQDLFRSNYTLHTQLYGILLSQYQQYLLQFRPKDSTEQPCDFLIAEESDYFSGVIQSLINCAKRVGKRADYAFAYNVNTVQPLVNVLLEFRNYSISFFTEFLELEQLLFGELNEEDIITRLLEQPLHVCLLTMECSIVSRRGVEVFFIKLIRRVFQQFLTEMSSNEPVVALYVAAYTLEMFRKHDIHMKLEITPNVSGLEFIGESLFPVLQQLKEKHLAKVLMVLCAALRLNPLILEKYIFQMTIWMIVTRKETHTNEMKLYEKYLELLMDMFRRLSRTEKFVGNLLKMLKEWLDKYKLPYQKNEMMKKAPVNEGPLSKRQKFKDEEEDIVQEYGVNNFYVQLLFKNFYNLAKPVSNDDQMNVRPVSFPYLQNAWPSDTIGVSFSKLITSLMSKPSLVVSKTLLYSLQETLTLLKSESEPTDNMLFFLDLQVALLCEYFDGCKLTEQTNKFTKEISEQYDLTVKTLKQFGKLVFHREDHRRLISAFLEISYHAANYHLLLTYYQPDGLDTPPLLLPTRIHGSLSAKDWELFDKRVEVFRQWDCRFLFNRLKLQRLYAFYLIKKELPTGLQLSNVVKNMDDMKLVLRQQQSQWFIKILNRNDKMEIANSFCMNPECFGFFGKDLEFLSLLAMAIYSRLAKNFKSNGQNSLLVELNFDYLQFCVLELLDNSDTQLVSLLQVINVSANEDAIVKLPNCEIDEAINALSKLPLAFLRPYTKNIVFALHLALYRDLKCARLEKNMSESLDILTDLLHFGGSIPLLKHLNSQTIFNLLPPSTSADFYKLLLCKIGDDVKSACEFIQSIVTMFNEAMRTKSFQSDHRELLLLAIDALSSHRGVVAKQLRLSYASLLMVYADYVHVYFDAEHDGKSKKDKKFVEKTIAGFAPYANYVFSRMAASKDGQIPELNESFRRICKIYLGHSVDCANPHGIQLLQVALSNRKYLHLDQDEIELLLSKLWPQLNADLRNNTKELNIQVTESIIRLVIDNKTNEDLLLILLDIKSRANHEEEFQNVTRLLTLIAKCHLSLIKGAIFNEQFKQISYNIIIRILKDERHQFVDYGNVLCLLTCLQAFIENKVIPISMDTLDSILGFLMNINIKRFEVTDSNTRLFHDLHLGMTELCLSLIKQRHILLMDRVPQFMTIFKDLLQVIVLYKSDRHKDTDLLPSELDDLAQLASKLEALSHLIGNHRVHIKRIAPFVLIFAINLIVTSTRSTTLYPKIKTHIESICHDFIGLCDLHAKGFILRGSNEGGRQLYETLVKDFHKYHKFKGKI